MNDHSENGLLMGFLLGAAIGAGVALLMAPASGEDTRRKLGATANRLRGTLKESLDDVKGQIRHGARDVGDAIAAGRDAMRRTTDATVGMDDA